MLWITNHTPEYTEARLAAIHGQGRRATRGMAFVAVGAAAVQTLLNLTYILCL